MSSQLPKTRVIPIGDFYTRLELEYISYKCRVLIYQRPFDKKKFTEICEKKKLKIDQIALENCLPSIFNNVEAQKRYLKKFFGEGGSPNFCYRDDYQTKVKGYWDLFYYYVIGSSVRFIENEEIEIGRIKSCDIQEKTLVIELDDIEVRKVFNEVTRIFPSNFYEKLFV